MNVTTAIAKSLLFFAIALLLLSVPVTAQAELQANFEWSMEPRYQRSWEMWDTETERYNPDFVNPQTYRVIFDACSSTGNKITEFTWRITGDSFAFPTIDKPPFVTTECKRGFNLPGQGVYDATLVVQDEDGQTDTFTSQIIVKDWLIVSLGDSLSSGEGNPDTPGDYDILGASTLAIWKDRRCHRSALSGPAKAAEQLEADDPHTSITFLSYACSGAEIKHLYAEMYHGMEPDYEPETDSDVRDHRGVPPQIQVAKMDVGDRLIDALLLTAGVNDLGFTSIVKTCIKNYEFDLRKPEVSLQDVECVDITDEDIATVEQEYEKLAQALVSELNIAEVYITDYPAAVLHGSGCGFLTFIGTNEALFIEHAGNKFNLAIERAARAPLNVRNIGLESVLEAQPLPKWNFVRDSEGREMSSTFYGHDYCAEETWFVGVEESLQKQGPKLGALHPNAEGHMAFSRLLLDSIHLGQSTNFKRITLTVDEVKIRSSLFDMVTFSVRQFSGDHDPQQCTFTVSEFGEFVTLPSGHCTFTLDVYNAPRSPRYATQLQLDVSRAASMQAVHDYEDLDAGTTSYTIEHLTERIAVKYTITVQDGSPGNNGGLAP